MKPRAAVLLAGLLLVTLLAAAQQAVSNNPGVVPPLIPYSGVAKDLNGKPMSGTVGVSFLLYKQEQGGAPLWLETQNVKADARGQYSVQLGTTLPNGIPTDLFSSGEARWLAVQISGQAEQPRVLLLSVPYALKAADAQTIGGLPPSAFVLAAPSSGGATPSPAAAVTSSAAPPAGAVTGSGTVGFLPLWDSTSDIISSVIFQSGTGSTAKIGINTAAPTSALDVKGAGTIRGTLSLPATGAATATAGKNSQPLNLAASSFSSGTSTAVNQTFQWKAEPAGNNTASPSGTLNLLFGQGTSVPAETGLKVANNGQVTFATGQTFPGTGTVTRVASGAGLTGGPISSSGTLAIANGGVTNAMLQNPSLTVSAGMDLTGGGPVALGSSITLSLDTTKVPQLNAGNSFSGNQSINGNISDTGNISATGVVSGQSGSFSTNSSGVALLASNSGMGTAVTGDSINATSGVGVLGSSIGSAGAGVYGIGVNEGVEGDTSNPSGVGVFGFGSSSIGPNYGVYGQTLSTSGTAVFGNAVATSGSVYGVSGSTQSPNGYGVNGYSAATAGGTGVYGLSQGYVGVEGDTLASGGAGVHGFGFSTSGISYGVVGETLSAASYGVAGLNDADHGAGIWGLGGSGSTTNGVGGPGILANGGAESGTMSVGGDGIDAYGGLSSDISNGAGGSGAYLVGGGDINVAPIAGPGVTAQGGGAIYGDGIDAVQGCSPLCAYAGYFVGDVDVVGALSKGGGSFKIDHPLDPANKYLYHSFVESPEMKNIYDGNTTTDAQGNAVVSLPEWFETLNRDFRYQLTVIGQFAQAIVASKILNNQFTIKTDKPNVEVSWQVTGIRQDAWANAHRIQVEVEKPERERGHYLYPELYGASEEMGIAWARHPGLMRQVKETRAKQMLGLGAGGTLPPSLPRILPRGGPVPVVPRQPALTLMPATKRAGLPATTEEPGLKPTSLAPSSKK
jgi:hypothetical protein